MRVRLDRDSGFRIRDWPPQNWSPYTPPDHCGIPSRSEAWVLTHPRNDPRPSDLVAPRIDGNPLTREDSGNLKSSKARK